MAHVTIQTFVFCSPSFKASNIYNLWLFKRLYPVLGLACWWIVSTVARSSFILTALRVIMNGRKWPERGVETKEQFVTAIFETLLTTYHRETSRSIKKGWHSLYNAEPVCPVRWFVSTDRAAMRQRSFCRQRTLSKCPCPTTWPCLSPVII